MSFPQERDSHPTKFLLRRWASYSKRQFNAKYLKSWFGWQDFLFASIVKNQVQSDFQHSEWVPLAKKFLINEFWYRFL